MGLPAIRDEPVRREPPRFEPLRDLRAPQPPPEPRKRVRWIVPLVLFLLTCLSTYLVGRASYAISLMAILTAHEFGHYFQARRYGVPASLPYFIPMPSLIGTMGAIIVMRPQTADRRALFDLAITGPIAGLVPALALSYVGLEMSTARLIEEAENLQTLGEPLVFKLLSYLVFGPLPEGQDIVLHPIAFAGWVGIFITALNLVPVGQLDGGHILYALVPRQAHRISTGLFYAALAGVVIGGYWQWSLMILLLALLGVRHPPTAGDGVELGSTRIVLGWLMLAFVFVGFTPMPFVF